MRDWFDVERIDDDTYCISEYRHWEEPHCYLAVGREHAVLIDSGLGVADISGVTSKLTSLPVFVLTTHVHWDHIGGHGRFSDFAVHAAEYEWINGHFPLPVQAVRRNLTRPPCDLPEDFDINSYSVFEGRPSALLADGDTFSLGGRDIKVIHTPGHSPGHCCFYDERRGYLFGGDLIYRGCLYADYPTTDPHRFYSSVRRVEQLDIRRILPGHHSIGLKPGIIGDISRAFAELEQVNGLVQASGTFDFGEFQIKI